MIARVTASGSLSTEPSGMMPALLTSTSIGPDLTHLGEEALPRLGAGHVQVRADGTAPDPLRDLLDQDRVEVAEGDRGALGGQQLGRGLTDPPGGTGDDDRESGDVALAHVGKSFRGGAERPVGRPTGNGSEW